MTMGKLAGYSKNIWTMNFADPTADRVLHIARAPYGGATITNAYAITNTTLAAGTANIVALELRNGGTGGTATTAIGTAGGTTGWTLQVPETFSLNASLDELASGEWLTMNYDETGTVAPLNTTVVVEWVGGKG
jgi:hypothetical protein